MSKSFLPLDGAVINKANFSSMDIYLFILLINLCNSPFFQSAPNNVVLSWGDGFLAANITEHLASEGTQISTIPYQDIFEYIKNMTVNIIVSQQF